MRGTATACFTIRKNKGGIPWRIRAATSSPIISPSRCAAKLSAKTVLSCGLALLMFFLLLGGLIFGYVYFVKLGK